MQDGNEGKPGNVSDTINAAANLAKAVPVYDDALQPLMKEAGKALSTVGKTVNVALAPIRGLVWGAEVVEAWLSKNVAEKLAETPPEEIVTPDLSIAGPTIEALKFNGHKAELSEMFAGLLAGAMKQSTKGKAHPAYVEIIKSMTPLDAKVFAEISTFTAMPTMHIRRKLSQSEGDSPVVGFLCPQFMDIAKALGIAADQRINMVQSSIENLSRLGLIDARHDGWLTAPQHVEAYEKMENGDLFQEFKRVAELGAYQHIFKKSYVITTRFGEHFASVVFGN